MYTSAKFGFAFCSFLVVGDFQNGDQCDGAFSTVLQKEYYYYLQDWVRITKALQELNQQQDMREFEKKRKLF